MTLGSSSLLPEMVQELRSVFLFRRASEQAAKLCLAAAVITISLMTISAATAQSSIEERLSAIEKRVEQLESELQKARQSAAREDDIVDPQLQLDELLKDLPKVNPPPPKPNNPISIVDWDVQYEEDIINEYYKITYTLHNDTPKTIKLLDGSLVFADLLGNSIFAIELDKDVTIEAGADAVGTGDYRIGLFKTEALRLRDLPKADIVATIEVDRIVFDDNSILVLDD